jgi:hypothetical protein
MPALDPLAALTRVILLRCNIHMRGSLRTDILARISHLPQAIYEAAGIHYSYR